jgi:endoglucanase
MRTCFGAWLAGALVVVASAAAGCGLDTGPAAGSPVDAGGGEATPPPSSSGGSHHDAGATDSGTTDVGVGPTEAGAADAGGGDSGALGGLTPHQMVKAMGLGWNLGNTFDANPDETSWGNPETTQAIVQAVQAAGFTTMRIPVTWTDHIGPGPAYTIDPAWMAKVKQVATWANDAGMYAIVNIHHDSDGQWILFNDPGSNTLSAANQAQINAEISAVWTQIAMAFRSYGDHLIFECFNEPHGDVNGYGGGDAASQAVLNTYLASCMNAIRGTGGNNANRYVMVQGVGAAAAQVSVQAVVIPNDDPNTLFSVHSYFPWAFASGSTTTWGGAASDYTDMSDNVQQITTWLPPTTGIVMGEWGSINADDLSSRVAHAAAYAQDITVAGMSPVWWDDGGMFVLLNRNSNPPSWQYPTILSALVSGYKAGAAPGATYATHP